MESQLLPGKLLSSFDFTTVPTVSKAHVTALVEGDGWIEQGANLLLFGPPGVGKSHLVCAIGMSQFRGDRARRREHHFCLDSVRR